MPAEEIFPDADINFKRSVNRIINQVGFEEQAKAIEESKQESKRKTGWGDERR